MPSVILEELSKSFGDVPAVKRLSLTVDDTEFLTLLGPSGCGKSTTLRMIAGLEQPDEGSIHFGERRVVDCAKGFSLPAQARNLGMVFQSYAIWPHMTVFQNVAYPLRFRDYTKRQAREKVDEMLSLVGLEEMSDRSATKLSGGQQQRVALARALVFEPALLLLDEPLSNLDAKLRDKMRFELQQMQKRIELTTVYVTHDQQEAMTLSDRIVVMNLGKAEQVGTPADVYDRPATAFVADFIGQTNFIATDKVEEVGTDGLVTCSLAIESGTSAITGRRSDAFSSALGERALVGVRPERVRVLPAEEGAASDSGRVNVLPGVVTAGAYVGDRQEYVVDLASGEEWRVVLPPDDRIDIGSEVALGFRAADTVVY